jgi:beta-carotene hydroxylase
VANVPHAAQPIRIPREKAEALRVLVQPPLIAWPTLMLFAFSVCGVVGTGVLAASGRMPLWAGAFLNMIFMYPLFGVGHDGTHRSISSNPMLSDAVYRVALFLLAPHATPALFRWAHMQHHRFTNGPKDPDRGLHGGPRWALPLRWAFFDVVYFTFPGLRTDPAGRTLLPKALVNAVLIAAAIGALCWWGYAYEVLMLWFIPARVTMLIFGFLFFWLPHAKDDVTAQENLTLATAHRLGHEWLLGPLLQFHNYHLLHHLWPATPPYRHPSVWRLMEPELRQRELAIQHGFAITPTIVKPGSVAPSTQ